MLGGIFWSLQGAEKPQSSTPQYKHTRVKYVMARVWFYHGHYILRREGDPWNKRIVWSGEKYSKKNILRSTEIFQVCIVLWMCVDIFALRLKQQYNIFAFFILFNSKSCQNASLNFCWMFFFIFQSKTHMQHIRVSYLSRPFATRTSINAFFCSLFANWYHIRYITKTR